MGFTGSLAAIGLPFAAWALLHSALAGSRAKELARRALGPGAERWYRVGFNAFALLSFLPILALPGLLPDRGLYSAAAPALWILRGLQAVAAAGLVLTARVTGSAELLLGGARRGGRRQAPPLAVGGPYRYVRHPLYAFALVLLWASPRMSRNTAILYVLMSLYFYSGSLHEERSLLRELGDPYAAYRRQVPRLVPWPGRAYRPPAVRPGAAGPATG